jgi:hypothetical protein
MVAVPNRDEKWASAVVAKCSGTTMSERSWRLPLEQVVDTGSQSGH